jgi:hypothetical protein
MYQTSFTLCLHSQVPLAFWIRFIYTSQNARCIPNALGVHDWLHACLHTSAYLHPYATWYTHVRIISSAQRVIRPLARAVTDTLHCNSSQGRSVGARRDCYNCLNSRTAGDAISHEGGAGLDSCAHAYMCFSVCSHQDPMWEYLVLIHGNTRDAYFS